MEGYYIRPSRVSPSVYFNPTRGIMDLRGRSCPENPLRFFEHLFKGLRRFQLEGYSSLTINMGFEYFNTSSSKCIYNMFRILDVMHQNGITICVKWFYEEGDNDMHESGEDLSSFFTFPFRFIKVNEIKALGSLTAAPKSKLVA